jgi:hypothetical protein
MMVMGIEAISAGSVRRSSSDFPFITMLKAPP